MQKIKQLSLMIVGLAAGGLLLMSAAPAASAIDVLGNSCSSAGSNNAVCASKGDDLNVTMKKVINLLLFIIGIIAVISIIIGGIMYTTSTGDQSKITNAKNTILYSVIGLIVAMMAFAIVNFVINSVG